MALALHLLGRPHLVQASGAEYRFRSRKSWAVLAYLVLVEQSPTRSRLAALLFAEADDPIRALRWSLSEVRRGLGEDGSLDGDPVVLRLPDDARVDVDIVRRSAWATAVALPQLGADLLDGMAVRGAAAFETWLLAERRHMAAASEAILHEAALGSMARGALGVAIGYAVRAAAMNPLDENHQALLIRLYRMVGDDDAAAKQFATCSDLLMAELGIAPGVAVESALRQARHAPAGAADDATIDAVIEAGSAAVSAGALEAGVWSLRTAVTMADVADAMPLRIRARLVLAEALIHAWGGLDEEGLATLVEADDIAVGAGLRHEVAQARAELGYVDFLRGRYERAELRLSEALTFANGSPSITAKAKTYLGSVASDRGSYRQASTLLTQAVEAAQAAGEPRREAFALAMLGRVELLRGRLDPAADLLDTAIQLGERDQWLSFMPWPQALRGELQLARSDITGASELLGQAFARACQLGDPCWEGMAARGLALLAEAQGETERSFALLADASIRCNRLADPYVWLEGYILDAQCALGRRHGHPDTLHWVETLRALASRTGMRELTVRSLLHGAALGGVGDAEAAALLAADLDNPLLVAHSAATP